VRISRAFEYISTAGRIEAAQVGTVQFIGAIAAVVSLVALEGGVDALAVGTMERAYAVINMQRLVTHFHKKIIYKLICYFFFIILRYLNYLFLPAGQALALHMNGKRLSQVVSSQDWASSARATSTHSPDLGSGCCCSQKPVINRKKAFQTKSSGGALNTVSGDKSGGFRRV
jgi:hypothetical protein